MHLQLRARYVTASSERHHVHRLDLLVRRRHVLPSEVREPVMLLEMQVISELLLLIDALRVLGNLLVFIRVLLLQFSLNFEVDGLDQVLQLHDLIHALLWFFHQELRLQLLFRVDFVWTFALYGCYRGLLLFPLDDLDDSSLDLALKVPEVDGLAAGGVLCNFNQALLVVWQLHNYFNQS